MEQSRKHEKDKEYTEKGEKSEKVVKKIKSGEHKISEEIQKKSPEKDL